MTSSNNEFNSVNDLTDDSSAVNIVSTSKRQLMVSLSYLAYCGDQITSSAPEQEILKLINNAIPELEPVINWEVVWGPATYTTPGSLYQDSMMYVAHNKKNTSQYAIAIRGTNFVSDLDWLMDDLDVLQMMPWPPNSTATGSTQAMISESTSIALQTLLNMTSSYYNGETQSQSLSLLNYLATQTATPIALCATGHSLGGCVASALALYLVENASLWDTVSASSQRKSGSQVSCVTFAAPTAGNTAFAALLQGSFVGATFDAVRCSLDVAPLAWLGSNLSNANGSDSPVFDVYTQSSDTSQQVNFPEMAWPYDDAWTDVVMPYMLAPVAAELNPRNYKQPFQNQPLLSGTFNTNYAAYAQDFETTANMFIQQATYQHCQSYPILLGIPKLNDSSIIVENPSDSTVSARKPSLRRTLIIQALRMVMLANKQKAAPQA